MVLTRKDRRGLRVKGGSQKSPDYYRVRVVLYLKEKGESNISDMTLNSKYDLSRANKGRLASLLDDMINEKWIKKSKYKIYSLDNKGNNFANLVKELNHDSNNPWFDFESFKGVNSL